MAGQGGWVDLARDVKAESDRKMVPLLAAGCAFYGLLALFPGIGAMMALAGIAFDPNQVVSTLQSLGNVLPQAAAEIIISQAEQVAGTQSGGLGAVAAFGILIALYSASKGLQAIIDGLNLINDRTEERGFVKETLIKLGLTLGLILGVLLCVAVAVIVPVVLSWLPLASSTNALVTIARWPVLLIIAAAGIALTYRVGPSRTALHWRWIAPGAALACILWLVGTAAFAVYVRFFGSYNETFGALGGVVILLMWLWLSSTVVLLGAVLSTRLEHRNEARPES